MDCEISNNYILEDYGHDYLRIWLKDQKKGFKVAVLCSNRKTMHDRLCYN